MKVKINGHRQRISLVTGLAAKKALVSNLAKRSDGLTRVPRGKMRPGSISWITGLLTAAGLIRRNYGPQR